MEDGAHGLAFYVVCATQVDAIRIHIRAKRRRTAKSNIKRIIGPTNSRGGETLVARIVSDTIDNLIREGYPGKVERDVEVEGCLRNPRSPAHIFVFIRQSLYN